MIRLRVLSLLSRHVYPVAALSCLSLSLLFSGCGNSIPGVAPAPTVSIAANPTTIASGKSSVLTVTASNALHVTVIGTNGSSFTLQPNGGTQTVSPTATTTYTATATGPGGSRSATATVTVGPPPAPTVTITATPASIALGTASTLAVTATNATQVTVTGTDGSTYTLKPNGGTQTVSPVVTTTYTATATGAGGKTSATATVTVVPPPAVPTVTIAAKPASITAGSSSLLTVTATNATQVTITGSNGATYVLQANGGTQSVSPTATTTYTATATGPGGKTSAATTVTVTPNPAPTVSITANPTSVTAGSSSILTVSATNATQVTITGTDHSSYTLTPTGGTQAVSPATTTTYTATAVGAGPNNTATASVTLTVTPNPPPTVTIGASPASITKGSSSTLTVGATNATTVTITGSDGSKYTTQSSGGTQSVSPTTTTTYTATATGPGGTNSATTTVTVVPNPAPTVSITANPTTIASGNSSTLTVTATNSTTVTIGGSDGSSYTLPSSGGTQSVSPTANTTYTATATGPGGSAKDATTVTVLPPGSLQSITHVIFMLQENHTFDNYFGMLNQYRQANSTNGQAWNVGDNGVTYNVDGLDENTGPTSNTDDQGTVYPLFKFKSTCIDDETSAWMASYGEVNTYDFLATRPILMDGFVHNAEGFANSCNQSGTCSGNFTDVTGQRSMGYYDQGFLNYYYYMASQFALSDRWFSPVSTKSIGNRIATFTGGTTQGLVNDPGNDDHLPQLNIPNIFQELDYAKVSWKIYYTVTDGFCFAGGPCSSSGNAYYPATDFSSLTYSYQYLYIPISGAACTPPTQPSSVVGDSSNSFCIDVDKIAPLSQYFTDLRNNALPSFAFIEAGYGNNDEHPGSGQSILLGQAQVANIVNSFMKSSSWKDSVFFLSYDEGGGPFDHVPPVPGSSNIYTNPALGTIPDISSIAVNPDKYNPCLPPPPGTPTLHCDLTTNDPGADPSDAAAEQGFAAQLGFRLPNMIISPFTRKHYVSHTPMDHTAVIKFVENRFIAGSPHLTARDAAQPNLLEFFDFTKIPWATPPTPPTPVSLTDPSSPGYNTCTPTSM
ncbi:MAG: alkaline phosphatase family protein [Acidobacteriaceae bacterium]